MYKEIEGDLITLAREGEFDVIAHGCNCYSNMGAGIAVLMKNIFGMNQLSLEHVDTRGDINKLGQIQSKIVQLRDEKSLVVVNAYTQYVPNVIMKPIDYEAVTLCLRKMNTIYTGSHIGLPKIGCGLAGGDWNIVKEIIKTELKNCDVTVVIYVPR